MRLVLDTNVMVAAMRSPRGASASLLRAVRGERLTLVANPALFLEYETVLARPEHLAVARTSIDELGKILSGLSSLIAPAPGYWTHRPLLADPDDEMVIEAAINGLANAIVTFETGTFLEPARRFGIEVLTPGQLWRRIAP